MSCPINKTDCKNCEFQKEDLCDYPFNGNINTLKCGVISKELLEELLLTDSDLDAILDAIWDNRFEPLA